MGCKEDDKLTRGKNIQLYLMDGDATGRIKCTLANWTGIAYKIPRTELDKCKARNDLRQRGVYFLFGTSDATDEPDVYKRQISRNPSHPAWGAWIEMQAMVSLAYGTPASHPAWGAWIEMRPVRKVYGPSGCRTPHGVRGLKLSMW